MKKPNFFIIGAPKCGTTSMSAWLSRHPQVFMSSPKELHFFNTDMNFRGIYDLDDYLKVFRNAGDECCAVGEASTLYLFSNNAVRNILNFQSSARFIVMLRNPLEAAQSLHTQYRYDDMEPIEDFEQAFKASAIRRSIGLRCAEPKILQYRNVVSFGAQVEKLLQTVCPSKVLFVFMDDLKCNPLQEYKRLLDFLDVEYDGRSEFPAYNTSKMYRLKWLNHVRTLVAKLNPGLFPSALKKELMVLNSRDYVRAPLRPEFKLELIDELCGAMLCFFPVWWNEIFLDG